MDKKSGILLITLVVLFLLAVSLRFYLGENAFNNFGSDRIFWIGFAGFLKMIISSFFLMYKKKSLDKKK